jgi:hypothetical protein
MISMVKDSQVSTRPGEKEGETLVYVEINLVPVGPSGKKVWDKKKYLFSFWATTDIEVEERVENYRQTGLKPSIKKKLIEEVTIFRDLNLERIFEVTLYCKEAPKKKTKHVSRSSYNPHRPHFGRGSLNRYNPYDYWGDVWDDNSGWWAGKTNKRIKGPVCPQARTGG